MTHTPGPWSISTDGEATGVIYALRGFEWYDICVITPRCEAAANARLIASAPDMLEALEEVMGELDVEGLPCPLCGRDLTIGHRHNCLWHVVESAVRKARQESEG